MLQGGIVTDNEGPLWYRGLAEGDEKALDPHVKTVLKNHQVERIVIGHTFTDGAITPRFGGKVLLIDIGLARLYDSKLRQACLLIENHQPYALHRGKKLDLPSDTDSDMLRYLKQAAALDSFAIFFGETDCRDRRPTASSCSKMRPLPIILLSTTD